jgi:hypothetical protein
MPDRSVCIVDTLLPPSLGDMTVAWALADALTQERGSESTRPDVRSWWVQTEVSAQLEPIMACEVRVEGWHSSLLPMRFQPGDTDVF